MSMTWFRTAAFAATALLAFIGVSGASAQTAPPAVQSASAPTSREAAAQMGKGFNLGQMFDNSQHPATLEAARPKIDAYYARGFRNLRIPVTWTEEVAGSTLADPDTGHIDHSAPRLAALTEVIDYALSKPGLYVVLNAHHEKRLKEDGKAQVLAQLWSEISGLYVDRDHRLMFEILNEPHLANHDPMAPATLRHMTGLAYDQIRARDTKRIIIIGGNQWFGAAEMAQTWPSLSEVGGGRDPYVMATFHHYNPWSFAGDNQGDYADAWTDADIRGPMEIMARWASTTGGGMPIYIGEWGVGWHSRLPTMNCNNIRLFYSRFHAAHASQMGMPTAVWDDGGWFQIFDHATNSFPSNLIDCIDGACTWAGSVRFNPDCL